MDGNILVFGSVKCYSDGDYRVLVYKNPKVKSNSLSLQKNNHFFNNNFNNFNNEIDEKLKNVFKIRRKIFDYSKENKFDYFATFTFNSDFSKNEERFKEMMRYLKFVRTKAIRSGIELRYLVVPELHKSGLIHFHGLFGGYKLNLVDSGHKFNNSKIYNIADFTAGFTNVQKIRSRDKVSNYITKYITKNLLDSPVAKGKKKYWCTKNLKLPREVRISKELNIDLLPDFDSEICSIYNLTKNQFEEIMGQF